MLLAECLGDRLGEFVALRDEADRREISCVLRDPVRAAVIPR
jgi:hypothetical protein